MQKLIHGVFCLGCRANEHTTNANKKTIAPADVFKALDDIEFGFLKEPLQAEFASTFLALCRPLLPHRQQNNL